MRMAEIQCLFGDGMYGMCNTSKLFRKMVDLYNNDRQLFEGILKEAKGVGLDNKSVQDGFYAWLKTSVPDSQISGIKKSCEEIDRFCQKTKILSVPLYETTELDVLYEVVQTTEKNKIFRISHSKFINKIIAAARLYYKYICDFYQADTSREPLTQNNYELDKDRTKAEDNSVRTVDFNKSQSFAYTKPLAYKYFGESVNTRSWNVLYVDVVKKLYRDYTSLMPVGHSFSSASGRIDLGAKDSMVYPKHISDEVYLEGNISATGIINKLRSLLSICMIDYENLVILYQCLDDDSSSIDIEVEDNEDSNIQLLVDFIKEQKDGCTFATIKDKFGALKQFIIDTVLKKAEIVKVIDKYFHTDSIVDYEDMANILLEVISRQFATHDDYISAKQLYDEARVRLDDFFFYNGLFDSRAEVYDLAVHLFEKIGFKGNHFVFRDKTHIWKVEPTYPMNYLGLVINLARKSGNTLSREEILDYLDSIGSARPAATFTNMLVTYGREYLLQYDENRYILSEAVDISEEFLACLKAQIVKLLDGDDYVALGDIDDYFYSTLPELPNDAYWSPLLLEDILRLNDIGYITIPAGVESDTKTVDAALLKKNSRYITFSDIVWNEIDSDYTLPRTFSVSEFRQILLEKGFIRGSEKMYSVHKTVADDLRFYWTENDIKVTISR